jgi:hypothetical protein
MLSHGHGAAIRSVLVVLVLAGLAGCGGGAKRTSAAGKVASSSSSRAASATSSGDSSVSTRDFIAHADAICREANATLARTPKAESRAQVAAAVVANETIERKADGRLAQLTPPAALASRWSRMLGYRRVLANQLGALAAATRTNATASVNSLASSKKRVHGELRRLATMAGFKDCAKVGTR